MCEFPGATGQFPAQGNAPRVLLLVDDDESVREFMSLVLRRHGFVVLSASGLDGARELALGASPAVDVLVLDASLSGKSGDSIVRWMLSENLVKRVIYISGYALEDCNLNVDPAVMKFLQKPFASAALLDALRTMGAAGQA